MFLKILLMALALMLMPLSGYAATLGSGTAIPLLVGNNGGGNNGPATLDDFDPLSPGLEYIYSDNKRIVTMDPYGLYEQGVTIKERLHMTLASGATMVTPWLIYTRPTGCVNGVVWCGSFTDPYGFPIVPPTTLYPLNGGNGELNGGGLATVGGNNYFVIASGFFASSTDPWAAGGAPITPVGEAIITVYSAATGATMARFHLKANTPFGGILNPQDVYVVNNGVDDVLVVGRYKNLLPFAGSPRVQRMIKVYDLLSKALLSTKVLRHFSAR